MSKNDEQKIEIKDISPSAPIEPKVEPRLAKKASKQALKGKNAQANTGVVYVRSMKGLFQQLRRYGSWFLLTLFFITPWIPYGDRQGILLDIADRKFHFFGITLWPQDLTLMAWFFIIAAFGLFFITTFLGRVWCGYLCPQTVWTFIFLWFEEKLEGSANKRKKLDQSKLNFNKFWRKAIKHFAWLVVSLITALSFAAWFVPVNELWFDFITLQTSATLWFWLLFFTAATYGNAGWLRGIVCTHMCPYARFQSAMFDKDTYIVGYDPKRGEARGPRKRNVDHKAQGLGDCIDCDLCVQVCPTGIDIRDGLQYECINCGACIDACDHTMERMNYPKGLIKYTTEHALAGHSTDIFRPKLIGYGVVMLVMLVLFMVNLLSIEPMQLDILRDRQELYRETDEGLIENSYTLKLLNKSDEIVEFTLSVKGNKAFQWLGPKQVTLQAGENFALPMSLAIDPYDLKTGKLDITFVMTATMDGEAEMVEHGSSFIGPM